MATAAKSDRPNGPRTPEDLENEIDQLKEDIAKLTKQLQTVGEHSYGAARKAAAEGISQLKAQGEHFRAQGEATIEGLRGSAADLEQQLVDRVREKPVTALAVAAGIGFLFALMSRR